MLMIWINNLPQKHNFGDLGTQRWDFNGKYFIKESKLVLSWNRIKSNQKFLIPIT